MASKNKNKNKVKFGLTNVHYAVIGEGGAFGTPKRIPGAVNLTLDAAGESNDFYADDMLYYAASANQGYTGTLELAAVTDDFSVDVLGIIEDSNGVIVENKDAIVNSIALLFEFSGDKNKTRHVLYNVTPSRPNIESGTITNTKEPKTESLPIVAAPSETNGHIRARSAVGDDAYTTWYEDVYIPELPEI